MQSQINSVDGDVVNSLGAAEGVTTNNTPPIYRYKFSKEFTENLYNFSKINKGQDKDLFKENWNRWKSSNDNLIACEVERLKGIGCDGDIEEKMFRSSRYYFTKKKEANEPKKRRKYVSLDRDFIEMIDSHISDNIAELKSPKVLFKDFCEKNKEVITQEIDRMFEDDDFNRDDGTNKIKKTYKNRCYLFSTKK